MENKKIILPEKRYEKAPEEDLSLTVGFENQERLLMNDDRDIVLDIAELYSQERNESLKYKIHGKIRMIFRNMYYGLSPYTYLTERLALKGDGSNGDFNGYLPYNEFAFLRNDLFKQSVPDVTVSSLSSFDGFTAVTTSGDTSHQIITPMSAPYHNWNLYLTYVYTGDTSYPMKYTLSGNTTPLSFVSGDGIPFRITDEGNKYKLTSPVPHGFEEGEYLIIGNKHFYVNGIGDETYDSENYVINILKSQVSGTTFSGTTITGKRCTDINNITGTTCQYYVHKHKVLTRPTDYIMDKAGFENPIFENERKILYENSAGINDVLVEKNRMESVLFDFKEPFVLTGITNNLNYTPTEVYLTTIFKNSNGYFDYPPRVGFKFNFHDQWIDSSFSGTNKNAAPFETSLQPGSFTRSGITFLSGQTLSVGDTLVGAFVEYNPMQLKERIISEAYHKINNPTTIFNYGQTGNITNFSGATTSNPFGLFFQPHNRIKLRELSPYVESSNSPEILNLPQNAKYFPDENLWRWRDLYDQGYIDDLEYGTDYPYINDIHYVKHDINLYIKNEVQYTNKANGIYDFNSFRNAFNLRNRRNDKNNSNNNNNNC